jgi:hypothetical protein
MSNSTPHLPKTRTYVMGFPQHVSDETSIKAIYRDAVLRLRELLTNRLFGLSTEISANDQQLLDGVLEMLVPPGHTISLVAQPQLCFKPHTLVVDDEAADWYDVADIKVGRNSQLANANRVPGSQFKASASQPISMDAAQISMNITVQLTNISSMPRRVPRVSMLGESA